MKACPASAMPHRVLFHAFLFGADIHMRALRGTLDQPTADFRAVHRAAVLSLNAAMADPQTMCADETILSLLILGHAASRPLPEDCIQSPAQGSLRVLQGLDIFSTLEPLPDRVRGLLRLLQMKGGVNHIRLPGLREMLSL